MNESARQAPPAQPAGAAGPRLWSPGVTVVLGFLFTPALGAAMQALNWRALGRADLALRSLLWALPAAAIPVVCARVQPPLAALAITLYFLAWYLLDGWQQGAHVRREVPGGFARRDWIGPVACGLAYAAVLAVASPAVDWKDGKFVLADLFNRAPPTGSEEAVRELVLQIARRDVYAKLPNSCFQMVTGFPPSAFGLDFTRDSFEDYCKADPGALRVKALVNQIWDSLDLSIENIRVVKIERDIRRTTCEADLRLAPGVTPKTITYTAQFNDSGELHVQVFGLDD